MKKVAALCIVIVFAAGCSVAVPFKELEPGPVDAADPHIAAESFKQRIPASFHLLSSIVFEYNWFTVAGLGYVDITPGDGKYKVVCMNLMGVKLFEFEGDRGGIISQYAVEPLARQGNIALAVGTDIKRVYLDLLPSADAHAFRRGSAVVFRQRSGDGALEYAFIAGKLASKTYREDHRAAWRVSYYEYTEKDGKLYPLGIIFTNYRYGYRLIVRQKEIRG